jgi:hypothetical protein
MFHVSSKPLGNIARINHCTVRKYLNFPECQSPGTLISNVAHLFEKFGDHWAKLPLGRLANHGQISIGL